MAIDHRKLEAWRANGARHSHGNRKVMAPSLGHGFGQSHFEAQSACGPRGRGDLSKPVHAPPSYGIAGFSNVYRWRSGRPGRLESLGMRSIALMPQDQGLVIDVCIDGIRLHFRVRNALPDAVVPNFGVAVIA
jgi:hypothetical protein